MKITYGGCHSSDRFLVVSFTINEPTWAKFCQVRVPLEDLLENAVRDHLDRAARRGLIQAWSEVDLADPLF